MFSRNTSRTRESFSLVPFHHQSSDRESIFPALFHWFSSPQQVSSARCRERENRENAERTSLLLPLLPGRDCLGSLGRTVARGCLWVGLAGAWASTASRGSLVAIQLCNHSPSMAGIRNSTWLLHAILAFSLSAASCRVLDSSAIAKSHSLAQFGSAGSKEAASLQLARPADSSLPSGEQRCGHAAVFWTTRSSLTSPLLGSNLCAVVSAPSHVPASSYVDEVVV